MVDVLVQEHPHITLDSVVEAIIKRLPQINRKDITDSIIAYDESLRSERKARVLSTIAKIKSEARIETSLHDKLSTLQEQIESGEFEDPTPKQVKAANKTIAMLKKAAGNKQYETGLRKKISELHGHLQEGTAPAKKQKTTRTGRLFEQLRVERDMLQREIDDRVAAEAPRGLANWLTEPLALVRSTMASMDISGVLRQGGPLVMSEPWKIHKHIARHWKLFASEKAFVASEQEIQARKNYPLYKAAGLRLDSIGGNLTALADEFRSVLAKKIPGIRQSERAMVGGLNKMRADHFDMMVRSFGRRGETVTLEEAKTIADWINAVTGTTSSKHTRGPLITTILWSPNLLASRLKLLVGEPLIRSQFKKQKKVRNAIALEYARYFATLSGVLGLATIGAMITGDEPPEHDARSSDFLKIRAGGRRFDFLGGLQQVAVLGARLVSRQTKTLRKERIKPLTGDIPYGSRNVWDVLTGFLRSKLAPGIGFPIDVAVGKNIVGEEVGLDIESLAGTTVPLAVQDMIEAGVEDGIPMGTLTGFMAMLGIGTYDIPYTEVRKGKDVAEEAYVLIRSTKGMSSEDEEKLKQKRTRATQWLTKAGFSRREIFDLFRDDMERRKLKSKTIEKNVGKLREALKFSNVGRQGGP